MKSVITLFLVIVAIVILHALRDIKIKDGVKPSTEGALTEGFLRY